MVGHHLYDQQLDLLESRKTCYACNVILFDLKTKDISPEVVMPEFRS